MIFVPNRTTLSLLLAHEGRNDNDHDGTTGTLKGATRDSVPYRTDVHYRIINHQPDDCAVKLPATGPYWSLVTSPL